MQAEVKRLDDSYRQILSHNELDAVRKKLEEGAQPNGLMLHYIGTHGDWLALKGGRRNGDPAGRRLIHRKICRLETAKCPIISLPQLSACIGHFRRIYARLQNESGPPSMHLHDRCDRTVSRWIKEETAEWSIHPAQQKSKRRRTNECTNNNKESFHL
jgi:hypothetical protein